MIDKIKKVIIQSGIACKPEDVIQFIQRDEYPITDAILDKAIGKYKAYLFSYQINNFDKEEKYISKSDKKMSFSDFIFSRKHLQEIPMPKNPLTVYIFGEINFNDLFDKMKNIDKVMQEKRKEGVNLLNSIKNA